MEFKWFAICATVLIAGLAVDSMVGKYTLNECRVAAINKGMTGEEVSKACQ